LTALRWCRRIKADPTNRTAIIAISGQPDWEKKILQAGADAFMAKPLNLKNCTKKRNDCSASYDILVGFSGP